MYALTINQINNSFLHDAAYVLSLRENSKGEKIFKFRSLYMDKSGECAISYYGRLNIDQIKEIMINFFYPYEDKSCDELDPQYNIDYVYNNSHNTDKESEFTTIFTPDGLNYNKL